MEELPSESADDPVKVRSDHRRKSSVTPYDSLFGVGLDDADRECVIDGRVARRAGPIALFVNARAPA